MNVLVTELGCAGHLYISRSCDWRRHTQVGKYRVSTVGNYYYNDKREALGADKDSFFESMVFETDGAHADDSEGCGCRQVTDYSGLEQQHYATAGAAQEGHERLIQKYKELAA